MFFRDLFERSLRASENRSPRVRALIGRTLQYLRHIVEEQTDPEIRPAMLAQVLGENEMIALTALYALERQGVVKPHVGLYCKITKAPIEIYEVGDPLPESMDCPNCLGQTHSLDDGSMSAELFFTIDPDALRRYRIQAA